MFPLDVIADGEVWKEIALGLFVLDFLNKSFFKTRRTFSKQKLLTFNKI